ncbi:MAG: hypothetical protein ACRDQ9_03455 [Pseudonocardiaceae bacterium]
MQTPLMVALVHDTYRPDDPVDELTDSQHFASREAIEIISLTEFCPPPIPLT